MPASPRKTPVLRSPRWTAAAGVVAAALLICGGLPASAGTAAPIGGPELAAAGVVVHLAPGVPPLPPAAAGADSWVVADLGSGAVLAARRAHHRYPPASTLKVLTALSVIPRLDPRRTLQADSADVAVDGSKVGLVPDARYRVGELETAMLVVSANDAARVLAHALGGEQSVVAQMAEVARGLQAYDTVPNTVTGLDGPTQSSSAYDLALLGRAAMADPVIARLAQTRRAELTSPGIVSIAMTNHNPLLGRFPGTVGLKNGYTHLALATYIGVARRGGRTVLVSLMHASPAFGPIARGLLDWGFAADGRVTPVGTLVGPASAAAAAAPPAAASVTAHPALAYHRPGAYRLNSTDWAIMGGVAGAVTVASTRRRRRRRRPRVRLPR